MGVLFSSFSLIPIPPHPSHFNAGLVFREDNGNSFSLNSLSNVPPLKIIYSLSSMNPSVSTAIVLLPFLFRLNLSILTSHPSFTTNTAGVTDDFVPFIVSRLNEMRKNHNILLVTNDHVDTLKKMADNTVTVSAIDRTKVRINGKEGVDRDLALLAMSIGDEYAHNTDNHDLKFFADVEFSKDGGIPGVAYFGIFAFGLFLLTFWDSSPGNEALVLIAAGMISFFVANPYFLQLTDWRIYMIEEAEALLHSSKSMNKFLKTCLTLGLLVIISTIQFGVMNIVIDTLGAGKFYVGILFDNLSLLISMVCLGLYTNLPQQAVQILGSMPFLFMIFFSTTFSPGAGVAGLKNLRYLFARYYLWCMTPGVQLSMEGCPESNNLLYLVLSSLLTVFLFLAYMGVKQSYKKTHKVKAESSRRESMKTLAYAELQLELFGEKALHRLQHVGSEVDLEKLASSYNMSMNGIESQGSFVTERDEEEGSVASA